MLPWIVKAIRIAIGAIICFAGLVLLPLPGPGMLVIAAGVALLARDIPWVKRKVDRFKEIPVVKKARVRARFEWSRLRARFARWRAR